MTNGKSRRHGRMGRLGEHGAKRPEVQHLERRQMLAVTGAEYDAIRGMYPSFGLPADMAGVNILEIGSADLSVANLKAAISAAGATSLPDLIVARTTDTQNRITYASSADQLMIDIPSSQGAINLVGFGSQRLTIDGAGKSQIMSIDPYGGTTTIANFGGMTFTGGNSGSSGLGGAIYQYMGAVTMVDVTISGNTASSGGGGLFQYGGSLTLDDVTISGNTAAYNGGGIYYREGALVMTGVTVSGNNSSGGYGGGLYQYSSSTSTLTDMTISGNTAAYGGGGLYVYGDRSVASATLERVTISGNTASLLGGGGMYQYTNGASTLRDVMIRGNTAGGSGGGLLVNGGTLTLANGNISGNTGSNGGGVSQAANSTSTLTNVTISGNSAAYNGGGISAVGMVLNNSIVARNTATAGPDVYQAPTNTTLSGSHNLIGNGSGQTAFVDGSSGNLVGTAASPIDPLFVDASSADPTQWDLHLQGSSPAVDAGDNALLPAGITGDLDGHVRVEHGTVDLGAYEYSGPLPPQGIGLSSTTMAENQPAGATVGSFSVSDPDAGNTFTYALVDGLGAGDNGSFTISGNQLQTNASFDHEVKNSYAIRVRVTDAGGLWLEKVFTVSVTNVNETPSDIGLSNASIPENQPTGTVVGNFSVSDPDAGGTFMYSLVDGTGAEDNGWFTIVDGELHTAAMFNYEAQSSYTIRVRATDQGGLWYERVFAIGVTDVNDQAPVQIPPTDGPDQVSVSVDGDRYAVNVNGVTSYYWIGESAGLSISTGPGDDVVIIGPGVGPVSIDGGLGNDSIVGSDGNDSIRGDDGNDTIYGGAGDDSIMGNTGEDSLAGEDGADQIQAGLGYDFLAGGLGNDSLYAGDQMDTVYGDEGDDYIEGRGKADTIYGGAGNDTILGGAGSDMIYAEDGDDRIWVGISSVFRDTVDGGAGSDISDGDDGDVLSEVESVLA